MTAHTATQPDQVFLQLTGDLDATPDRFGHLAPPVLPTRPKRRGVFGWLRRRRKSSTHDSPFTHVGSEHAPAPRRQPGRGYHGVFAEVTEFATDLDGDDPVMEEMRSVAAPAPATPQPSEPAATNPAAVSAIEDLFATEVASHDMDPWATEVDPELLGKQTRPDDMPALPPEVVPEVVPEVALEVAPEAAPEATPASGTMTRSMSTDPPGNPPAIPPTTPPVESIDAPAAPSPAPAPANPTPTAVTPPPSDVPVVDRPVSWWSLGSPAVAVDPATGRAVSRRAGLILDTAAARLATQLTSLVGRPVELRRQPHASPLDAALDGFAVRLRLGDSGAAAVVAVDLAAAQGLIAPLIADSTSLQTPAAPGPSDPLNATALGLLEFLGLAGLDALLRDLKPDAAVSIESFGNLDLYKHALRNGPSVEVAYQMHAGPARGTLHVAFTGLAEPDAEALRLPVGTPNAKTIGVSLALPAIELSPEERQALAVGDVLLLGGPDLETLAADAALVTDTGWQLGPATLLQHQPGHLIALPSALQPRPVEPALAVRPCFGRLEIEPSRLAEHPADQPLRLPLDAQSPVTLVAQGQTIARGEPVILGQELGVRLLWIAPTPAPGSAPGSPVSAAEETA